MRPAPLTAGGVDADDRDVGQLATPLALAELVGTIAIVRLLPFALAWKRPPVVPSLDRSHERHRAMRQRDLRAVLARGAGPMSLSQSPP